MFYFINQLQNFVLFVNAVIIYGNGDLFYFINPWQKFVLFVNAVMVIVTKI